MKTWIVFPALGSVPLLWFILEGFFGHLMLHGRCDERPRVSEEAPVLVSGFLELSDSGCLSCEPSFFEVGYKYIEFEVSNRLDVNYWRTAYGILSPGFYRLEVSPRSNDATASQQRCDDNWPGLRRFRSTSFCPRLTAIKAPESRYQSVRKVESHDKFLGTLNEVIDQIENRETGELLYRYRTYSWTPNGRGFLSLILNPQDSVFGYGGAACPHKRTPDPMAILLPNR